MLLDKDKINYRGLDYFNHDFKDGVPPEYKRAFYPLKNKMIKHFKATIADIIKFNGDTVKAPMSTEYIENYLEGFKFVYLGYDQLGKDVSFYVKGEWHFDKEDNTVYVIYNRNLSDEVQRYTKVHELIHFCQWIDGDFKLWFNELIRSRELSEKVTEMLLEKATEKATAIFLMPNKYFIKKFIEIRKSNTLEETVIQLAGIFRVSRQTASYRIKECCTNISMQI